MLGVFWELIAGIGIILVSKKLPMRVLTEIRALVVVVVVWGREGRDAISHFKKWVKPIYGVLAYLRQQ